MNLVATVAVRNQSGGPEWLDITVPRIKRYADRIGAAFLEVRDSEFGTERPSVFYAKLHAYESGQQFGFDRLLYLDADILVDNEAPDIFAELPPGKLYARRMASSRRAGGSSRGPRARASRSSPTLSTATLAFCSWMTCMPLTSRRTRART